MSLPVRHVPLDVSFFFVNPEDPRGPLNVVSSEEIFRNKRVALFAVPGAFSPTCSGTHLPDWIKRVDEMKSAGVDTVACLSVNDTYVMKAWQDSVPGAEKLLFIADVTGEFTQRLGLQMEIECLGPAPRAKRFALMARDGRIEKLMVDEDPDDVELTRADSLAGECGMKRRSLREVSAAGEKRLSGTASEKLDETRCG